MFQSKWFRLVLGLKKQQITKMWETDRILLQVMVTSKMEIKRKITSRSTIKAQCSIAIKIAAMLFMYINMTYDALYSCIVLPGIQICIWRRETCICLHVSVCLDVDVRWFLKFFSILFVEPGSLTTHEAHCTVWLGWLAMELWGCVLGSTPSNSLYRVAGWLVRSFETATALPPWCWDYKYTP